MRAIGIVGASGTVGRSVLRHLRLAGAGPLRLGARGAEALQRLAGAEESVVAFDLSDAAALQGFCAGCAVVVNAAGPTRHVMDRVARAALAAGADYVDAAGDEPVHARLATLPAAALGARRLVLSAGIMPGLTALLPRALAHGLDGPLRLTAQAGGLDRFTRTAAEDYVASLSNGHGAPLAAWRHQRRVPRALTPLHAAELPFFPRPVSAFPYLSQENERLAQALRLEDGAWYNVFEGPHLRASFGRIQHLVATEGEAAAVDALCRAATLDLAGQDPYQLLVCRLTGRIHGVEAARSLLLRTADGYALTGALAAFAALDLRDGTLPPGLHYAGEAMDPAATLARLRNSPAVAALQILDADPAAVREPAFEDGAL